MSDRCPPDWQTKTVLSERGGSGWGGRSSERAADMDRSCDQAQACWSPSGTLGALIDRHQADLAHRSVDPFDVHRPASGPQMPCHLPHAVERNVEKLPVALAPRRSVEGRAAGREQLALANNRQVRAVTLDHRAPHLPIHGLSFSDKLREPSCRGHDANPRAVRNHEFTDLRVQRFDLRLVDEPRSNSAGIPSKSAFYH